MAVVGSVLRSIAIVKSKNQTYEDSFFSSAIIVLVHQVISLSRSPLGNLCYNYIIKTTCSKLLEHIITSNITHHLREHNILYHLQHGLRSGWSCETQLQELTATLYSNLAARKQTDLIILDFLKAFDKVCHAKLFSKLDYYGIRCDAFNWIKDFLTNRKQSVVVDGEQSSYLPVLSGVPQDSAICPALFIIYTNDLPE